MNSRYLLLLSFLFSTVLVAGCTNSKPVVAEQAPPTYQATPISTPTALVPAAAPKVEEVDAAVKRVFKDLVIIDPDYKSSYLVGDFNGDNSQDLAVVLKPVPEKIAEMNEQPIWLLRDPHVPYNPRAPLKIEKDDVLLAVIHGYGANDWRDQQATQTYLLKNVAGASMRVQNGKDFGKNSSGRRLPRPQGDLISETLKGREGYLYYSAATYSWYDPKTYEGEAETAGAFHGRAATRRTQ